MYIYYTATNTLILVLYDFDLSFRVMAVHLLMTLSVALFCQITSMTKFGLIMVRFVFRFFCKEKGSK